MDSSCSNLLSKLKELIQGSPSEQMFIETLNALQSKIEYSQDQIAQLENHIAMTFNEIREWSSLMEEREQTVKSILDSSNDIILTFDQTGHVTEFNHTAAKIFGMDTQKSKGKSILEIIPESDFHSELKKIISSLEIHLPGNIIRGDRSITNYQGTVLPTYMNLTRLITIKKSFYVLYIRDLTEELLAKALIDDSRSKSAQAAKMASLGEMAGGIAHEINSPLSVILMNSEIIAEEMEEAEINKEIVKLAANHILKTSTRISKIINGLRKFSRDDNNSQFEITPLPQLIEDSLSLCRQRLKEHNVELIIEDTPNWDINCKPVGLSQVILNLIHNANDAIENLETKWIKLLFKEEDGFYSIYIQDCGKGIPESIQKKLMEPFFTTKAVGKGTGLGLSISKGILEAMKGSLTYCELDSHTAFKISIPKVEVYE